jgi:antitoxin VapB
MPTTARPFTNGRSHAVRLPRAFRLDGQRVPVRRVGRGVLVEPIFDRVKAWFAELDRVDANPFMADRRRQPRTPVRELFR